MRGNQTFYVGTYTRERKEGIYHCTLNSAGVITVEGAMEGGPNPSFLATDSHHRCLYAVNEMGDDKERPDGTVSAFAIDPESGSLRLLNSQLTQGTAPCHITIDKSDRFVLAANYGSGSVVVFPIRPDGSLGQASGFVQHTGSSANPKRQQGPHAHCVAVSHDNRFVYAVDLGIDKVTTYAFDAEEGKLQPAKQPWAQVPPGTGPRHLTFDQTGRWMYLINELSPTLMVYAVDVSSGSLEEIQTVMTVPEGFSGDCYGAEVHVSSSGKFVYGSNRGPNTIAVFAVDNRTGKLSPVQHQPTDGRWPRDFALDPTGEFLVVANERSDAITVLAIDQDTGLLTPTGHQALVPSPVCVLFV